MLSRCCKSRVEVQGDAAHYYACTKCGRATDLCWKTEAEEQVSINSDLSAGVGGASVVLPMAKTSSPETREDDLSHC